VILLLAFTEKYTNEEEKLQIFGPIILTLVIYVILPVLPKRFFLDRFPFSSQGSILANQPVILKSPKPKIG